FEAPALDADLIWVLPSVDGTDGQFIKTDGSGNLSFATGGVAYQQVVTVAKDGGDYTTITAALNAILDAATDKRYAILVYPGDYAEVVTCKAWVDIIGIDRHTCRIKKTVSFTASEQALIYSANDVTLKNLSILLTHGGSGFYSDYIIRMDNTTDTFIIDNCKLEAIGSSVRNTFGLGKGAGAARYIQFYNSELRVVNTTGSRHCIAFGRCRGLLENSYFYIQAASTQRAFLIRCDNTALP
ncbi:unnamed protein product, partial [marine sediment metagenome]